MSAMIARAPLESDQLQEPLWEALKATLPTRAVLHADETPVPMLNPGLGHTHKAYSGATAARHTTSSPGGGL